MKVIDIPLFNKPANKQDEGAKKANAVASKTLRKMEKAVGFAR